jgi:hypothetical protein
MPKRSNEFQALIARIYLQLAAHGAQVTESVLLRERTSNAEREVDVLIEQVVVGHRIRIAVECRDRKDKDDITWIDDLIGRFSDLEIDRVIAVSSSGFTKTAASKAAAHRIDVLTLEEANETDWPSQFTKLYLGLIQRQDNIEKVEVGIDPIPVGEISIDITLFNEHGNRLGTLGELLEHCFTTIVTKSITEYLNKNWKLHFKTSADFHSRVQLITPVPFDKPCHFTLEGQNHVVSDATFWTYSTFVVTNGKFAHYLFNDMMVSAANVPTGSIESVLQVIQVPSETTNDEH